MASPFITEQIKRQLLQKQHSDIIQDLPIFQITPDLTFQGPIWNLKKTGFYTS